jgi:hypothetical protein
MQNTTSYNKPEDAGKGDSIGPAGKCDYGSGGMVGTGGMAGKGGAFTSGGDSNQAGSGFSSSATPGGMGDMGACAGMADSIGACGGKADNCAGMADKKTPAPEIAQGGPLQTYSGDAGWKN